MPSARKQTVHHNKTVPSPKERHRIEDVSEHCDTCDQTEVLTTTVFATLSCQPWRRPELSKVGET